MSEATVSHGMGGAVKGSRGRGLGGDAVLAPLRAVGGRFALEPLSDRLDAMRALLDADRAALSSELEALRRCDADLAQRAASWLLQRPGKRVRPLCVVLGARLCASDRGERAGALSPRAVHDLALACELAHNATLLHDDGVDLSDERRGERTARLVYGNSASVLGGDHLLVESLRRVHGVGVPALLASFLDVIAAMVAGEALQLERRGRFDADPAQYDRVIAAKTASLFAWALRAGATAGGATQAEIDAAARFGHALGVAFQLVDDALDVGGDPLRTGKDGLLDLREGKLTWPLLVACEREPSLLVALRAVAATPEALEDADARDALRRRLRATGCVEATRARARIFAAEAREALDAFPPSAERQALEALAEAAVERDA